MHQTLAQLNHPITSEAKAKDYSEENATAPPGDCPAPIPRFKPGKMRPPSSRTRAALSRFSTGRPITNVRPVCAASSAILKRRPRNSIGRLRRPFLTPRVSVCAASSSISISQTERRATVKKPHVRLCFPQSPKVNCDTAKKPTYLRPQSKGTG